jgi:hypothetical protein
MHIGYCWKSQKERDHWEDQAKRTWVDNIKIDLREVERNSIDWTYLAQHREQWRDLVNTAMNLRVP